MGPPKTSKKDAQKALVEMTKLAEQRLERLKYLQADFDNYRKRFEREREDIVRLANESIIRDLLSILDDLEGALKTEKENRGLGLLHQKLLKILESHGLRPIESVGKHLDPHYHEVLLKEASDKDEEEILEEFQKGYTLKGKVIRPSRVKISGGKGEQDG